jgi:hypothetical protein
VKPSHFWHHGSFKNSQELHHAHIHSHTYYHKMGGG